MLRLPKLRMAILLALAAACLHAPYSAAQDDPNEIPLGDVARTLRKKAPPTKPIIDNDNFSDAMDQAESKHGSGSALRYLMAGEARGFQISGPDATCNLSFSANAKALLSSQYAQMDLPPSEVNKLEGPAAIEGDALTVTVRNRTDWHVSEVTVALTVVRKNSPQSLETPAVRSEISAVPPLQPYEFAPDAVRPEKPSDVTVIYHMRAAAPPGTTTVFNAPLNVELASGEEWHWGIVQARGYPPEGRFRPNSVGQTLLNGPALPIDPSSPAVGDAPLSPSSVSLARPQ